MWSAPQCLASLREVNMREVNESGETDFHAFRRGYSKNGELLSEGIDPAEVVPAQAFHARYTSEGTQLCPLPVPQSDR